MPYKNKASGCDTPLCDTISKGYGTIWGVISHWAAKLASPVQLSKIVSQALFQSCAPVMSNTVSKLFCTARICRHGQADPLESVLSWKGQNTNYMGQTRFNKRVSANSCGNVQFAVPIVRKSSHRNLVAHNFQENLEGKEHGPWQFRPFYANQS